jgi:rhodanese-related sulfurtransferase
MEMIKRCFTPGLTLIAVLVLLVCLCVAREETMSKEELKALMGKKDVIVLDVRIHGQYDKSPLKIKGAVRQNPIDVKSWARKYSRDATIVLYCS